MPVVGPEEACICLCISAAPTQAAWPACAAGMSRSHTLLTPVIWSSLGWGRGHLAYFFGTLSILTFVPSILGF